jgi:hypothetical protein
MIYYDDSEGRANTRLSQNIVDLGQPVVGLEPATGADLLITPREGLAGNVNRPPGKVQLPMYLENSFLVQRKSGSDFLNSIPKLMSILWRMRVVADEHNARPWLMVCGNMDIDLDDTVRMDGRTTGWRWGSVQGALEAWQLVGGHVSVQPDDTACGATLQRWDRNIGKWIEDVERAGLERQVLPALIADPNPWRTTLMTFPGCGDIMSAAIAEHTKRLIDAIVWMSEPKSYGVRGVGAKTLERFRQYLGLQEHEHLLILNDEPTIHGAEVPGVEEL